MLAYMGTVIVILLNILIAQMSTTYTQARRVARLEYDVDRISLLTRMERFPLLVSMRRGMVRVKRVCSRATFRDLYVLRVSAMFLQAFLRAFVRVTLSTAKCKRGGSELSTDEQNMAPGSGKAIEFRLLLKLFLFGD